MADTIQEQLYEKFNNLCISSRDELRERISEVEIEGINQQIIEGYFAEYRKSGKDTGKVPSPTIKVAVLNDTHIPYHNKVMVKNFIQFCKDEQPDQIILNGDMVDFYDLSSFDKNPDREGRLQEELDTLRHLLSVLHKACPNSKIIYVEGNHEDRLRRYLWKNAKSLSSLRALKFEELLGLKQHKVEYVQDSYFLNGFEFTHGDIVRTHSSYSAKAEYEKHHSSGCSGHTHRMGVYCKSTYNGTFGWWENGCGCELNPEYIKGVPDWQNGFCIIYFDDNAYDVHQVYVNKGHFRVNGIKY